jgi:competence protein ComEC
MSMKQRRVWVLAVLMLSLVALNAFVAYQVLHRTSGVLTVSFLDVGQGDAILIQGPTGVDMLIDGGADKSVVRELPRMLGPLDRHVDMVVATHPDKDHIGGLPEVFLLYDVDALLTPGLASDTDGYDRFVETVAHEEGLSAYVARNGQRIALGGGAYADVLYPDKDVSHLRATNDASIALRVVYGESSFLLTGDMPSTIEDKLVQQYSEQLQSDVLKAGHHGSKYSTSALWLSQVAPRVVVISAGRGNTYGHPAPEVLERVGRQGAETVSTIDEGTITFVSDGALLWRRK